MDWLFDKLPALIRRHWWVFVLVAITIGGTATRAGDSTQDVVATILAVTAVLALLVRDRRPEVTWLVASLAVTVYFALDFIDGPVYLSLFCAGYALALRREQRRALPYAATLVLVLVAMVSRWHTVGVARATVGTVWFLLVFLVVIAIGYSMRTRTQTRREQAKRAATEERLRMAQDLHDGVGHGLAVIAMQAGVALHVLDREPEKARESLKAIRESSTSALAALRAELDRLADAGHSDVRTPSRGLADLPALVDRVRAGGLEISLRRAPVSLAPEADEVAYLVVQEALTNVLRHANADRAVVEVARDAGTVTVTVSDDGRGNAAGEVKEGIGLRGMRTRVESLGGTVGFRTTPQGFEVRAELPEQA